jgi:mannitol-specific phosphotransferase system IIBC component
MQIAGYIIAGLAAAIVAILAVGATILNIERKNYERKLTQQAKEAAENEKRKADIITETEKIKQDANTGNHSNDLHTMADQLHHYAQSGK